MRNLIQNERLKLYKKASTWILVGIVVALAVFSLAIQGAVQLFIASTSEESAIDWQREYQATVTGAIKELKSNPQDGYAKADLECFQYMLDNQIDPSHWKYGLMMSYRNDLGALYSYEVDPKGYLKEYATTEADMKEIQQSIAHTKQLVQASDWREYVRMQIEEVKNGNTAYNTPEEKQIQIDIWNMYLDYNIQPAATDDPDTTYDDDSLTWQQRELTYLRENKLSILRNSHYGSVLTASEKAQLQDKIALSTERIKTNTPPVESDSLYGMMEASLSSMSMLTLLLAVLAGGMIANEFSSGTIKLLLITPHKRRSVFWAKVVVLAEITLIATGALFVLQFLVSGLFGGFNGIGDMYLTPLFGSIVRVPYLLVMLYKNLLFLLPVFAFGALALMLSAVTRKAAAAVAVPILLMYGGEIVNSILCSVSSSFVVPGVKFLLVTNTNLDAYFLQSSSVMQDLLVGGSGNALPDPTMSLLFSIAILVVHIACFLWIARDSFCRRDVK